jgi:tetratricopeptide (TPR) repeat protein
MAHKHARQFEQAEQAYRQALAIEVQQQDRRLEAATLTELGTLYRRMGRLEEAVNFHGKAAEIDFKLQNRVGEGKARNCLANALIELQRYNEARVELHRVIECYRPYGFAAEPWLAWHSLFYLEQAAGNAHAAETARGQAVASYLAYRRAGGESQSYDAQLFDIVFQAIQQGATTEAEQYLDKWSEEDDPLWAKTLVAGLQAILRGDRDPALAADPNLDYGNAVELQLLLEALQSR